ncbi:MAG TPA: response regulator transcription factor [Gemmatimonadales bacterium]|nr:response regulator transcription factor [Gemmatimonadales bacterium]
MTSAPVRVLVVDDHPLVRAGVRRVLESEPGFEIAGEAEDGAAALEMIRSRPLDIVVLDLALPGIDGLEVLRQAKAIRPELRIVVLTMHASAEYLARAIRSGADAYLLKESAAPELLAAVRAVQAGRAFHSPRLQAELANLVRGGNVESRRAVERLTEREREVLRHIAAGRSSKEIAVQLGIGVRTVETHRANLMRKLGIRSIALLTQFAIREGVEPTP